MLEKEEKEKVTMALFKKALGYDFEEVTEEFSLDEESGRLLKNKVKINKKHLPPDLSAVKELINLYGETNVSKYDNMTEDELLEERKKLLKELELASKNEIPKSWNAKNCVKKHKKCVKKWLKDAKN